MRIVTPLAVAALLILAMPTMAQVTYPSSDTPIAIPDSPGPACGVPGTPITSTINVPDGGAIEDVDVFLDISHTWVGDLRVVLSNGTTSVDLVIEPGDPEDGTACGDGSDNLVAFADDEGGTGTFENGPFPYVVNGRYTPNEALSAFDGGSINGDWTLTVTDTAEGDTGTLNSWELSFTLNTTANEPVTPEQMPDGYLLENAYPNPFNPSATIGFAVRETQDARLTLHDALGRAVRSLYVGTVPAGVRQEVQIDGAGLPSGLYLVRFTGADFTTTRRVTLLK